MAFPPDIPDDQYVPGQVVREVIKNQPYSQITQNSPHFANFVFGQAADIPGGEHQPDLPVLKLIDFGRGREEPYSRAARKLPSTPLEFGSRTNLYAAALSFVGLCCLHAPPDTSLAASKDPTVYFYRRPDGTGRLVNTQAPAALRQNRIIDPQLRHLLVRIITEAWADIPPLPEVLAETEAAVASKGPDDPDLVNHVARAQGVSETDETLRVIAQRYLYNPS